MNDVDAVGFPLLLALVVVGVCLGGGHLLDRGIERWRARRNRTKP